MRSLILATQFLTRLPTPQLRDFTPRELASSAQWFPTVGVVVGTLIALMAWLGLHIDSWLGALLGLLMWMWVTGGLHLDGLADLADGLGAAHRSPERLLAVMRDPHLGAFGVMALIAQLLSKLVLLQIALHSTVFAQLSDWTILPLICAWARFGALIWSATLPALSGSSTDNFTWSIDKPSLAVNALLLLALSYLYAPIVLVAPLLLALWFIFLKLRVGGMSGDCLGAGIEIIESSLLLCVVLHTLW